MALSFRPIRPEDDAAVAAIIRTVMPEFGADGPGFALHDPEVDFMSRAYAAPGAAYCVVVDEAGRVLGGGGVAPLQGGEPGVCELKKMYFLKEARGGGMGERLLRHLLDVAQALGHRTMYLETLSGMDAAMRLYERVGFRRLCAPMGATGHGGCDTWYAKELTEAPCPITVDWSRIASPSELWESLLHQSGAPEWHGRNLNALRDSWVRGDINRSGPPYAFRFLNRGQAQPALAELADAVLEIARESVREQGGSCAED